MARKTIYVEEDLWRKLKVLRDLKGFADLDTTLRWLLDRAGIVISDDYVCGVE